MKFKMSIKKLFSSVLAIVLCLSFSITAFADVPEVEKHTVTFNVPSIASNEDDGVMLAMWDSKSYTVPASGKFYTSYFAIPNRYFAYEVTMTFTDGTTSSSSYCTCGLFTTANGMVDVGSFKIDGNTYKEDWITVTEGESYHFIMSNQSSKAVSVQLVYYSWV